MDVRRLLFNGVGLLLGGGLMYALVKKSGLESKARTLSATIVEGGAITGGALVGYHLSNFLADRLLQEGPDSLPKEQAASLPSGDAPVETPTSESAMGNVAEKAKAAAATPSVTPEEIAGGKVIDITKGMRNE